MYSVTKRELLHQDAVPDSKLSRPTITQEMETDVSRPAYPVAIHQVSRLEYRQPALSFHLVLHGRVMGWLDDAVRLR